MKTALEMSKEKQRSTAGKLFGRSVIYGREEYVAQPYAVRYWLGRLRFHIFYRGDADPDCHNHPWDFWTFPFTSYVEEVIVPDDGPALPDWGPQYQRRLQVVPAWRFSFRPATHTHRVLGKFANDYTLPYGEPIPKEGKIYTLVWRSRDKQPWGFFKNRDGKWCWQDWKSYVHKGGKHAPCEPSK